MARTTVLLLLSVLQELLVQTTIAVTCYGYGGLEYPDNSICPGSNACCGSTGTCLSNRLCHNQGDNNSTFVRGPCAVWPYSADTCATICLYNETTGFLPRITVCADGSYCCDELPYCCEDGAGVFLDITGDILTSSPSASGAATPSTVSSPSSASSSKSVLEPLSHSTTESSTSGLTVATASSETTTPASTSPRLSTRAKVGIGIGVSITFIIIEGLVAMAWIQRRQVKRTNAEMVVPLYTDHNEFEWQQLHTKGMAAENVKGVVELPAS